MSQFGVLIPVGPDKHEISRLHDVLDSLFFFEKDRIGCIVIIDDYPFERSFLKNLSIPLHSKIKILKNPRNGKSDGSSGGLCCGIIAGLKWFADNASFDFILKLDTDSFVINKFYERVQNRFISDLTIGILGTYKFEPNGNVRITSSWNPSIKTFLRYFALRGRYFQTTLFGSGYKVSKILRKAIYHGYQLGDHCQGGGYAIRKELLVAMLKAAILDHPLTWLRTGLGEDIMMGIISWSLELPPTDYNRNNEVFGVTFSGLAFPPEELIQRGYSIIHSLKRPNFTDEIELRSIFKKKRYI
jgi:hypothetical protein